MKNLQHLADTMSGEKPLIQEAAADALARWDEGDTVFTIEMGGLGPGYEQAIQLLVFEMIRDHLKDTFPPHGSEESKAHYKSFGEKAIARTDESAGGYTGAMVGAAKTLAYRAIRDGWAKMVASAPDDRRIQVSKAWPQAPAPK